MENDTRLLDVKFDRTHINESDVDIDIEENISNNETNISNSEKKKVCIRSL